MATRTALKRAPQPADRHVASRVRMRRHMLGLSQQALAAALGVTFQQIQKYENGANRISAGRLRQIADALGCHPGWFFGWRSLHADAAARRLDADLAAFLADKYAAELVPGFLRLPRRVKRAIVAVIRAGAGLPA